MKKLILFDIDGTLIQSGSGGINRFTGAIKNVHDLAIEITKNYQGSTDRLIMIDLLQDEGWNDSLIQSSMPQLLDEINHIHKAAFKASDVQVLPGVVKLLKALSGKDVELGLITGNVVEVAKRKLEVAGIYSYFKVGGFGDDPHKRRADLVSVATTKAGFTNKMDNVFVIGDTPLDIKAASEAGVKNSVGVTNGYRDVQELVDAGAKIVLKDFSDTDKVIKLLSL